MLSNTVLVRTSGCKDLAWEVIGVLRALALTPVIDFWLFPGGSHLRFYIILPFYPVPKAGFDSVLIQDVYRTLKATLWLRP